jgi:site-specific recombinase XerD
MVPIGHTAHRYLETYIKAIRPFLLRDRAEMALFLNARGVRYSYSSLQVYVQNFMRQFDFDERITAHTFRRSCATEMIRSGANVYHVKELLGHETLRTLHHYLKLTIADLKRTHEKCHPRERDEP